MSTAYWPNLHYFYYLFHSETIFIEQFENYQKQSYRNRARILSANGPLDLSIPVKKKAPKGLTKDIQMSYAEAWQIKHWRAITSAYKNSPYFEHFESEIQPFYTQKHEHLLAYNLLQIQTVLNILKLKKVIQLTRHYEKTPEGLTDLREKIHPKLDLQRGETPPVPLTHSYYQTFENKFEFVPNLSILDLIFNKGLETIAYFKV